MMNKEVKEAYLMSAIIAFIGFITVMLVQGVAVYMYGILTMTVILMLMTSTLIGVNKQYGHNMLRVSN